MIKATKKENPINKSCFPFRLTKSKTWVVSSLYWEAYIFIQPKPTKKENINILIRSIFSNIRETSKKTSVHTGVDDDGKSKVTSVYFVFENQDAIAIQCYNYSVEAGDQNHLRIGINTKEYLIFIRTKAYK